jgi:nucleotide-binding universal stress UspA family protein
MSNYDTLLVPHDFSAHARAATEAAADLARRLDSSLHLVHVVQTPAFAYGYGYPGGAPAMLPIDMSEVVEAARATLEQIAGEIDIPGKVECHVAEALNIADRVQTFAEDLGADMIVMGTHGRTGLAHVFLGSIAERTLRSAPCPVLTVQATAEAEAEDSTG